jgi:hypothetical protein
MVASPVTTLPVILHPSISQARLLTPHLASLTYDYQMFVLRKGRDAENFPRLQNRTLQFLFGAQKPPANEAQATTSLNHGYTLGLSQSGPATAIRPCRLSGDADSPLLCLQGERSQMPQPVFIKLFTDRRASDEFCAVGVPASRRYTDAGAPAHQQSRDSSQCP